MKKAIKKTIIGLIFCLGFICQLYPSHYLGGNIGWTCLGNDTFLIKMTIYRDCNGVTLGNLTLNIKCLSSGQLIRSQVMSKPTPIDITSGCGSSCSRCQSSSCAFPYGVEKYVYMEKVFMGSAGYCCELLLEHQGTDRSSTITTGDPGSTFYISAMLNRCISPCNNSPEFSADPISIICIGLDFIFDFNYKDFDTDSNNVLLDSLSFEWTPPLVGYNAPFTYSGTYAFDHPIFYWGFKNAYLPLPRGIHLDRNLGTISFRPMRIEQTVMAVKISEWRKINGVQTKISETKHDFSIIVIICPANNAPTLGGPYYKEVCIGDTAIFTITTNDLDVNDSLTISWNNAISVATWTDNNGQVKHPTAVFTWKPDSSHARTSPYIFIVTVKDNACPIIGSTTRAFQVLVKPIPEASLTVIDSSCGYFHLSAQSILGKNPVYRWDGKFNTDTVYEGAYFPYQFNGAGKYPFTVEMDAQGCISVYHDTIEVDTFIIIQLTDDHEICFGDSTTLDVNYSNNRGPVKFKWQNGNTNPKVSFVGVKDTIWTVEVSDNSECVAKGQVAIKVHPLPKVSFYADPPVPIPDTLGGTIYTVNFYDSSIVANLPAIYLWNFGNQTTSILQNPVAIYQDTGNYNVDLVVTDHFGCISNLVQAIYVQVVGVEETQKGNQLTIYPNPTDDVLFIKSSFIIKEIRLINSVGKVVWHERDLNTMEHKLDGRQKGFYLLEITDILGVKHIQKLIFY